MHPDVQTLVNAFAALTVPINWKTEKSPYVNVKFFNAKTNQVATTVRMMIDSGASATSIGGQYAKAIGVNIRNSKFPPLVLTSLETQQNAYTHRLKMQIGNLAPIVENVNVVDGVSSKNLIGWNVLSKVRLEIFGGIQNPQARYTELAMAAMGNAGAYFRSRV